MKARVLTSARCAVHVEEKKSDGLHAEKQDLLNALIFNEILHQYRQSLVMRDSMKHAGDRINPPRLNWVQL